jgi:Xaa-Pro dipeptidase
LFDEGADSLSFPPIVLAAEASALPHASARADYVLKAGDPLLVDFGARWGGMAADVTRTAFLGHATEEGRAVYDAVLRANRAGQAATRAGVTAHHIDDTVMKVLEATPYADRIACKTGHGLGRDVHEEPYIMRGNQQVLETGVVFTNEPGLYEVGNFGVRIEDVLLVTDTGCRELTSFPKELRIVG